VERGVRYDRSALPRVVGAKSELDVTMADSSVEDAASYARRHAGELSDLTPAQRDLLGRVVARRIERGVKIETIARAVAHALPELGQERAHGLGRDEALRALAWERLSALHARGERHVVLSPAADACLACRAAAGVYSIAQAPAIPVAGCAHVGGCRCLYHAPDAASAPHPTGAVMPPSVKPPTESEAPARPWYRPRPPRPHGPRWADEERAHATRQPRRPPSPTGSPSRAGRNRPKRPPR
jgi:hypothetical protein